MMKENMRLSKTLYNKKAILFTLWLNLDADEYTVKEDSDDYLISFSSSDEKAINDIIKDVAFNSLRFGIAEQNKDLRKSIISKALWTVNYDK